MQRSGSDSVNAGVEREPGCACGTGSCKSFRLEGDRGPGLPSDAAARKALPIGTGVLDYFPLALAEIAKVSLAGQQQHGTTGWDRSKSTDEADALIRHYLGRMGRDTDGNLHSAKMAWRALALLQKECEAIASPGKKYTFWGYIGYCLQILRSFLSRSLSG